MKKIIYGALAFAPVMAFAQDANTTLVKISDLVIQFGKIIKLLIPITFGIAIIYFFWGVAQYILSAGDPAAAAKGKSIMIYGVIAIAVMASLYGIVAFLQTSLGVSGSTNTVNPPEIKGL